MSQTKNGLTLTEDQVKAKEAILAWYKDKKKQVITLGGYAGTGKTTVIAETINHLPERDKLHIGFCCFTGKAANVLRTKLTKVEALGSTDYCGTIHSLMYKPIIHENKIVGWTRRDYLEVGLLVVDEASMVGKEIWKDLSDYKTPILAVGDHGQLPPVNDSFNLLEKPDLVLEKIHRQAENNPIIKVSMMARLDGFIPQGEHGSNVRKVSAIQLKALPDLEKIMFLCGWNKTRKSMNTYVRAKLGLVGDPKVGDKVICLKNNKDEEIFNGMLGTIKEIKDHSKRNFMAKIEMDGDITYEGLIYKKQFFAEKTLFDDLKESGTGELFDFGYFITVHKSQGSEADKVVLYEERSSYMSDSDWKKWLYTGVTRAKSDLTIVGR